MSKVDLESAYAAIAKAEQSGLNSSLEALRVAEKAISTEIDKLPSATSTSTAGVQQLHAARARLLNDITSLENTLTGYETSA